MCRETLTTIIKDQSGDTYDLLAALVSVDAIGVMGSLGVSLGSVFNTVTVTLTGVVGS